MSNRSLSVEQILILLAEAPRQIKELTGNLPIAQLHSSPHYGEWSVHDVLSHLRACADVWGKCIIEILTQDKPVLRAINPRNWIQQTDYPQQKFRTSLRAFAAQRTELLAVLAGIARQDWSRIAVVIGVGQP